MKLIKLTSIFLFSFLMGCQLSIAAECSSNTQLFKDASSQTVSQFLNDNTQFSSKPNVVTFIGFSGKGYKDEFRLFKIGRRELKNFSPSDTIINIGATADGIGALYSLAKDKGFKTMGIVSSQAESAEGVNLSKCVDYVFYIKDSSWGGIDPKTNTLFPTSQAMIDNSDHIIQIGGGLIGQQEVQAAREIEIPVKSHKATPLKN
ncbi:hypothetical protein SOPP22_07705 [Shewanella sp. OPT22]|nr:hypothetical protein SOPP22_07705 [Shewanella sp. OPT22]